MLVWYGEMIYKATTNIISQAIYDLSPLKQGKTYQHAGKSNAAHHHDALL